jgi:sialate O-acetylesterase
MNGTGAWCSWCFFAVGAAVAMPAVGQAPAAFRAFAVFGDHMVVPVDAALPLRGLGPAGIEVTATATWGAAARATVAADGRWRVDLAPPARGVAGEITLVCGSARQVLHDLIGGDVWLASGQSNMEMTVGDSGGWRTGVRDWRAEVAAADLPTLRFFTAARRPAGAPADEVDGAWRVCSPATAGACSAAAFFAARDLIAAGKGPQGLVVAAWGGTVCEAWTSPEGLRAFPEFAPGLRAASEPPVPYAERAAAFWRAVPEVPTAAMASATEVNVPDDWAASGLRDHDGVVFYERRVALPAGFAGQVLALALGPIDDRDTVWANGVRIGGHEDDGAWEVPRRYEVPAAVTAGATDLVLRVRVLDTGGDGRFGSAAVPPALTPVGVDGAAAVPLAGPWSRCLGPKLDELPPPPRDDRDEPNRPAVLWHGMVAPLVPFPFTGVFWYQGESNRGRAEQYARLFPAMVADWRRAFARPLPFFFVQIAPFAYDDERGQTPALRQAQAAALALPRTGMVVALDAGETDDIHPRDKQTVGRRLALQARQKHYGDDVVADGPTLRAAVRDGADLRLEFTCPGGPLVVRGDAVGFEVVGADGAVVPAPARLAGDDAIVLPGAAAARVVRYGWAADPRASVFGRTGVPAAPFLHRVGD